MKIFCTGNPKRQTVAYALDCDHASLSSGWDFTNNTTMERFQKEIINYDVFVNSCYVAPGVQLKLMDIAINSWTAQNIKGHVINIGTTLENTDDQSEYTCDKRQLRKNSLESSDQTGITGVKTTYLIIGGIDNGLPKNSGMVTTQQILSTILWVLGQVNRVPLLQLDGNK